MGGLPSGHKTNQSLLLLNTILEDKKTNLVILGEAHSAYASEYVYPEIYKNLITNNRFDCVFLEAWSLDSYK
jgi:hypothetical protein